MRSTPSASGDIFHAIDHPVRRALLVALAGRELSLAALVRDSGASISRPGVSQHLAVMEQAGLVQTRRQGRQRLYRLDPAPLATLHNWVAQFEPLWRDAQAQRGADVVGPLDRRGGETRSTSTDKSPAGR